MWTESLQRQPFMSTLILQTVRSREPPWSCHVDMMKNLERKYPRWEGYYKAFGSLQQMSKPRFLEFLFWCSISTSQLRVTLWENLGIFVFKKLKKRLLYLNICIVCIGLAWIVTHLVSLNIELTVKTPVSPIRCPWKEEKELSNTRLLHKITSDKPIQFSSFCPPETDGKTILEWHYGLTNPSKLDSVSGARHTSPYLTDFRITVTEAEPHREASS